MGIEKGTFVKDFDITKIDLTPEKNVRKSDLYEDLEELQESLKNEGFYQPVIVAPKKNGRYEIIVGTRRYLAAKVLKLDRIPAIVFEKPIDEVTALKMSIIENIHRKEPAEDDIVEACKVLHAEYGDAKTVSNILGISKKKVDKYLTYLDAPKELKAAVTQKKIPRSKAIDFVTYSYDDSGKPDEEVIRKLMNLYLGGTLTDPERDRISKVLKEIEKKASIEEIKKKVKTPPKEYILKRIVMPWEQGQRLEKASDKRGDSKPTETARIAIIDWLDAKGY